MSCSPYMKFSEDKYNISYRFSEELWFIFFFFFGNITARGGYISADWVVDLFGKDKVVLRMAFG